MKIYEKSKKYIDYKMGGIGAGVMGSIVWGINYSEGTIGATTAALKQGVYTLITGGLIMKTCENLATKIKRKSLAMSAAIIIPSLISIGATYGVHKIKGTPKPEQSTIPVTILAPPSFAIWAKKKRNKLEKKLEK
jgi:hypothetical protein